MVQINKVDGLYSHGAKFEGAKKHLKMHRARKYAGADSAPFDWTKPLIRNYSQPIKNQYGAGMCGGEEGSQHLQIYRTVILGFPFQELSEISIYSPRCIKGTGGMYLSDLIDCLRFGGATLFSEVPTPNNCTEAQAENTGWETDTLLRECASRTVLDVLSVNRNIDSIAQAIRDFGAVGFLLGGSNNGTWGSEYPQPPMAGQTPAWFHFMCSDTQIPACSPMSAVPKQIPMNQSWGASVGNNGKQIFDENFINSGFIYDCFAVTKHIFNTDLKFGMISDEVKYLQVKLGILPTTFGFGVFGPRTLAAVKNYQIANNITPVSGYVGPLTRQKLNM